MDKELLALLAFIAVVYWIVGLIKDDTSDDTEYKGSYSYGSLSCDFTYCRLLDIIEIRNTVCSKHSLLTLEAVERAEELLEQQIRKELIDDIS